MKIFRFMSKKEFNKLINGEKLINNTKHKGNTNSEGFCFMEGNPEWAFEFLSGVVSEDICVVFETDKKLKKTYGIYADPCGSFFETITKDELCTNTYNKDDFKIIKIAIPDNYEEWNWYTDIEELKKELDRRQQEYKEEMKRLEIKQKASEKAKKEGLKELETFFKERDKIKEVTFQTKTKEYKFKNLYIHCMSITKNPFERGKIELKLNILF